jgi:hypothetical protein
VAELADALDSGSSVRNGRGGSNPLTRTDKDLQQTAVSPFFVGWSTGDTFSGDTGDTVIHPVPSCDTSDSDRRSKAGDWTVDG